jgi:hypothetical protein
MWQFISLAHHIYLYTTPAVMGGTICLDYGSRTSTVLRDMSYTGVTVDYTGFKGKAFGVFAGTIGVV